MLGEVEGASLAAISGLSDAPNRVKTSFCISFIILFLTNTNSLQSIASSSILVLSIKLSCFIGHQDASHLQWSCGRHLTLAVEILALPTSAHCSYLLVCWPEKN